MTEENIVEPKIRVLVVDDSAIMRRIITTALKMDPGI
jgi:chemotaxis response regulator CheB